MISLSGYSKSKFHNAPAVALSLLVAISLGVLAGVCAPSSDSKARLIADYNKGDFKGAEAAGQAALIQHADDAEVHYYLGNALTKLGKHDAALAEYRQSVALAESPQLKKFAVQALESALLHKESEIKNTLQAGPSPKMVKETELGAFQSRINKDQFEAENRLRMELSQAKRIASERLNSRRMHAMRSSDPSGYYRQSSSDEAFYMREIRSLDEEYARKVQSLREHAANALSQTNCGTSTIRVMPSLSSSKVRNYINYSDQVEAPVKAPPESLNATALPLGLYSPKTSRANGSAAKQPGLATGSKSVAPGRSSQH